jgi:uncharacterized protein (DUF488 family)
MKLYTIGHSNHSFQKFAGLLQDHGIDMLVDVRSAPYSRYNPHFNKDSFETFLPKNSIEYLYAGKYLGGRPSDPSCYKSKRLPEESADYLHEVDYPEVMLRPWFTKGIQRLIGITEQHTVAVMCSEEDPAACHRHHLIAQYLMIEFPEIEILHIRGDGTVFRARSIRKSVVDPPPAQQLPLFKDG